MRRDRIGPAPLAAVAAAGIAIVGLNWPDRETSSSAQSVDEAGVSIFDDPTGRGVARPPASLPALPPLGPPVTFDDGTVAMVTSVEAFAVSPSERSVRGAPALIANEERRQTDESTQQGVLVRVQVRDPQPLADQDHLVRIDGRVAWGARSHHGVFTSPGGNHLAAAIVDRRRPRVHVEVGVATGPFIEVARARPGTPVPIVTVAGPTPPLRIRSVTTGPSRMPGRTAVNVDLAAPGGGGGGGGARPDARSWVMQAVRRDGRAVTPSGLVVASPDVPRVTIDVPFGEVDYVTYRHRAYAWRSLGEFDVPPPTDRPTAGGLLAPPRPAVARATPAETPE